MMGAIGRLLDYVEIRTKITSVFPFIMTLAYLFVNGKQILPLPTAVFFLGMFLFDLTATTINNYNDTKKNDQTLSLPRRTALAVTVILFILSASFGIYLVTLSDIVVLIAGGVCFLFGVFYSYGPIPISHGPYGEAISGFFYGVLIPFILVYINNPTELLTYSLAWDKVTLTVHTVPVISFLLLAVLPSLLTANIMLANNICDVEHDVKVQRFTLPFYLKRRWSLYLFAFLYYTVYISVIAMVVFGFLPPLSLLLLVTIIPVQKNIKAFFEKQVKGETFAVSIKNFLIIITVHIALIFLGALLPGWGPQ